MAGQRSRKARRHALVEQNGAVGNSDIEVKSRGWRRVSWETSEFQCSHRAREHALLRFFEKRDYLLTRYAREILEEFVNGISALEIINQVLDRHSGAGKARRSAHDFGIDFDD